MRKMFSQKQIEKIASEAASGLPEIESGDAGKALMVNSGETGVEWAEIPTGLPEIESGDAGKLLAVNAGETGAEWVADNSLKLPGSAPASQQLVGVNTSGIQNALGIGEGLEIVNNTINNWEIWRFGAGSTGKPTITQDQVDYILEKGLNAPIIVIQRAPNTASGYSGIYIPTSITTDPGVMYTQVPITESTSYNAVSILKTGGDVAKICAVSGYYFTIKGNSTTLNLSQNMAGYSLKDSQFAYLSAAGNADWPVSDGVAVSDASLKKLIQNSAILRLNGHICYPMYRDTTNLVDYYFNTVVDGSGNLVETVYKFTESTWVVTITTKTIS